MLDGDTNEQESDDEDTLEADTNEQKAVDDADADADQTTLEADSNEQELDDEGTLEADTNEQETVDDKIEDAEDEDDELPPHLDLSPEDFVDESDDTITPADDHTAGSDSTTTTTTTTANAATENHWPSESPSYLLEPHPDPWLHTHLDSC